MAKKIMRHASALKAKRQNIVRKAKNVSVRSRARTLSKNVLAAIAEKNIDLAQKTFKLAQSEWQKAGQDHTFHPKSASRHIARLASKLAALSSKN